MEKKNLSTLRKEKGLSRQELANQFNLSSGAIAMYETGQRKPSLKKAIEIAQFFDIRVELLVFSNAEVCEEANW